MRTLALSMLAFLMGMNIASAQTREEKVRADRQKIESEGLWIYNDLAKGNAIARDTGKPIFVVLRCIPCEECVKLDEELMQNDRRVRSLLEQFILVRLISTNGLDLKLFQYDYDQSFAAFFLNADGTIYGRFGTRSHRTSWSNDVAIEGLAKALEGALDLHRDYPKNKNLFIARQGPEPEAAAPELLPLLKDRYSDKLKEDGLVKSCIHCHQIGDALRDLYHAKGPIPESLLFPYPHPKILGLILDPRERATVQNIVKDSPAELAGFQKDDVLVRLEGQPLLSIADVQWVLHRSSAEGATLQAVVQRGNQALELKLELPKGWRQKDDISWRVSTWGLRRMSMGGMYVEEIPDLDRQKLQLSDTAMALRVKFVGQYGPHAAAQKAGIQVGDILVDFDGRSDFRRETDLIAHALFQRRIGDTIRVTVLRSGKQLKMTLPLQ